MAKQHIIYNLLPYYQICLKDGPSPYGGIDGPAETVSEFLESLGDNADNIKTLRQLNKALKQCGISPIKKEQLKMCRKTEELYCRFLDAIPGELVYDKLYVEWGDPENCFGKEITWTYDYDLKISDGQQRDDLLEYLNLIGVKNFTGEKYYQYLLNKYEDEAAYDAAIHYYE